MFKCNYCQRDIVNPITTSCRPVPHGKHSGASRSPIFFGAEPWTTRIEPGTRCPDCNVTLGGWHHPNCDIEQCPWCGGWAAACACCCEDGD